MYTQRTQETKDKYLDIMHSMVNLYYTETGREWSLDPTLMAHWLGKRKGDLSLYTWRVYRASMRYVIEEQKPELLGKVLEILDFYGVTETSKTTKVPRLKHISESTWDKIIEVYLNSQSMWLGLGLIVIQAGIITGLRPGEWAKSRMDGDTLIVRNSKHTNGRAFDEFRHLNLSTLNDEQKKIIQYVVSFASSKSAAEWKSTLDSCRQSIHYAAKKANVPGFTLYSARHQAVSNARKSKLSDEAIAAMLGHASVLTSKKHYGTSGGGHAQDGFVTPSESDVSKVQHIMDSKTDQASHDEYI